MSYFVKLHRILDESNKALFSFQQPKLVGERRAVASKQ